MQTCVSMCVGKCACAHACVHLWCVFLYVQMYLCCTSACRYVYLCTHVIYVLLCGVCMHLCVV